VFLKACKRNKTASEKKQGAEEGGKAEKESLANYQPSQP